MKIAESKTFEEHLNQYDVIHVDINAIKGMSSSGVETVKNIQCFVIEELREIYSEGVCDADCKLPYVLTKINNIYGAKFIIIIDEWDAIFRENKTDEVAQKEYFMLLLRLFKTAPSKRFLKFGYMTGSLPISKYKVAAGLNNFDEISIEELDMLTEYGGFVKKDENYNYQTRKSKYEMEKLVYF